MLSDLASYVHESHQLDEYNNVHSIPAASKKMMEREYVCLTLLAHNTRAREARDNSKVDNVET